MLLNLKVINVNQEFIRLKMPNWLKDSKRGSIILKAIRRRLKKENKMAHKLCFKLQKEPSKEVIIKKETSRSFYAKLKKPRPNIDKKSVVRWDKKYWKKC
jgi:hypothetical protein